MFQTIRPSAQKGVKNVGQNAAWPPAAAHGKWANGHHFWSQLLVTTFGHHFWPLFWFIWGGYFVVASGGDLETQVVGLFSNDFWSISNKSV